MNDLTPRENAGALVLPEQVDLIRRNFAKDATPDELQMYFYDCQRQGVHPMDKLIHFTKRGGRYVPITSIDFMRMKAMATKEYVGSDDAVYTGTVGQKGFEAKVVVYRLVAGERYPWTATARWEEYYPGDTQGHMWKKLPHVMLSKCAEALALRKAFADVLHGLYVKEEMDQAEKKKPDTTSLREKVQAQIVTASPVVPPVVEALEPDPSPSCEGSDSLFDENMVVKDAELAIEETSTLEDLQQLWDEIVNGTKIGAVAKAGLFKKYQARTKVLKGK
jgi:phage recombination protein Bet